MTNMRISYCYLLILATSSISNAFEIPNLKKFFKSPSSGVQPETPQLSLFPVAEKKAKLLETISFTANGKNASPTVQEEVLAMVAELEENCPVSNTLLTDASESRALDGTWFLQYTSPSTIGDGDNFPNAWKPQNPSEGEANIETKRVNSKGTVTAAGLTVDTSNRVVKQVFDIETSSVYNEVELDFGIGRAGGTFRESPTVPNRALVSFNEASITFKNGFVLDLGWIFTIIAIFRKSNENGWLETTYLDSELRIGRGNKGTMFILTRDRNAVQP